MNLSSKQQSTKIESDDGSEVSSIHTIEPEETLVPVETFELPRGMHLLQEKLEACVYAEYVSVCKILQDNCIQFLERKELPYPCLQSVSDDDMPKTTEGLEALGLGLSFFETPTLGLVQRILKLTTLD